MMWQRRGEFLLHDKSQSLPILAIPQTSKGTAGAWGGKGGSALPPGEPRPNFYIIYIMKDFSIELQSPYAQTNDLGKQYYNPFQNGRVIDITKKEYNTIPLFDNNNDKKDNFKYEALQHIQTPSPLGMLFFSKENMNRIQTELRYTVWIQSGKKHIIGEQSAIELEIIMRAIFLQFSLNQNQKFKEQIEYLNKLVLDYCIPNVMSEVEQYLGYLDNVQKLPNPLPLPENLSSAGTKTLRSVTTTF
jgi:hypothetical protein